MSRTERLVGHLKGDSNTQHAYEVSLELRPVEVLDHGNLKRRLENPSQGYELNTRGEKQHMPPGIPHGLPVTPGPVGPGAIELENAVQRE